MPALESAPAKVVPVLGIYADAARAKLEKLQRRAAKYGQTIAWTETRRVEIVKRERPFGTPRWVETEVERVDFAVTGEAPRVGEFKFIASLERLQGGVLVSSIGGDVEVGALGRDWDGRCEHCHSNRARSYGFVVEGPDGDRKVVGKSCLRDFTGCDVPASAISLFQYLRDFGGGDDELEWGGSGRWAETLEGVIATTRACIALWGWRPSSHEGMTTSSYVNIAYEPARWVKNHEVNGEERKAIAAELAARGETYAAEAQAIIAWGRALTPATDYLHNLRVALSGEFATGKTFNLIVSACAAYDRQVAREDEVKAQREAEAARKAALPKSDWVGAVGDKVDFGIVTVERVLSMPDRGFGPSQLYKFRRDDGAVIAWFSASYPKVDGQPVRANDRIALKGTVKAHKEFGDERETAITRAKLAPAA